MGKSASLANIGAMADTPLGYRDKVINGNFEFWQRGTANGSTDAQGFLADRFRRGVNGSTLSQSRQAFALGQTAVPGEPTYYWEGVVTSSAGSGNYALLGHPIESVRTLAGQKATVSFYAKADASRSMSVELAQVFGAGGSPSSAVLGIGPTKVSLTTSWQKFTVTVDIPSISGKTLGTDGTDHLLLDFWFDAGSSFNSRTVSLGQQSGTFSIARVRLEPGPVALEYEDRHKQTELALCQRYYWRHTTSNSYDYWAIASTANAGQAYALINHPVIMRATPTVFESASATNFEASGVALSAILLDIQGARSSSLQIQNASSGWTASGRCLTMTNKPGSTSYIGFGAEL